MSTLKAEVEQLLNLDMNFRNSDKALILQIWKNHGLELNTFQLIKFREMPGPDSILRRRRELSAKYPASEAVTEHRFKHFKKYQAEYSEKLYPSFLGRFRKKHV